MDLEHPYGKPINILKFSESQEVIIDNKGIDKIFNHPEIQDRKVVILSLIGTFRSGKSFFLDYCLRFLYANYSSMNNSNGKTSSFPFELNTNWMGSPDEPLKGFSWRLGAKRETIGFTIWSDVFLHTMDRTGEKIAIFVMDTPGLFDHFSTPTDNSRIFALGTLISSIQVFNLNHRVQEDQLQYLQFTTEFAQFILKNKTKMEEEPFQNLTFLIRDWNHEDDFPFGFDSGEKYIKDVFEISFTQKKEHQFLRKYLQNSFKNIDCCLLPYPGKNVASRKNYNGQYSLMEKDFFDEFKNCIEHLLKPEKLVIKKINSRDIIVNEMKLYIQGYINLFQSNEIPQAMSIYECTVECQMNKVIEQCLHEYKLTIFRNADLLNEETVPIIHKICKQRALELYDAEHKMGTVKHDEKFRAMLVENIDKTYACYKEQNEQVMNEIQNEGKNLQAELIKEEKLREDVEKAKNELENQFMMILERRYELKEKEYRSKSEILEKRLHAEKQKLKDYEKKVNERIAKRNKLIKTIGATSLVLATVASGGAFAIAGLATATGAGAGAIAAASVVRGVATVTAAGAVALISSDIINKSKESCSIM